MPIVFDPSSVSSSFVRKRSSPRCELGAFRLYLSRISRTCCGVWSKYPANSTSLYPICATRAMVPSKSFSIWSRTE
jgi:hypothetical protein